jgi:hypothetical protein
VPPPRNRPATTPKPHHGVTFTPAQLRAIREALDVLLAEAEGTEGEEAPLHSRRLVNTARAAREKVCACLRDKSDAASHRPARIAARRA